MQPTLRSVALLAVSALAACGSIPTKTFVFDCVDAAENPRPCMIVINEDYTTAAEKAQFVNVASDNELVLEIPFPRGEVEVTAVPVLVEGDKVTRVPKSRIEGINFSGFVDETRRLRLTDHKKHMFILARRNGS